MSQLVGADNTLHPWADVFIDKNEINFGFDDEYLKEIENNIKEEMENIDLDEEDDSNNKDEFELKENVLVKPKDSIFKRIFGKKR